MLENVKNLQSHDKGRTFQVILEHLKNLGYWVHTTVLNSLDFGVPQKRERTIIVGFQENIAFSFPKPFASELIKDKRKRKVKPNYPIPSIWHEKKVVIFQL